MPARKTPRRQDDKRESAAEDFLPQSVLLDLYRTMLVIRQAEERIIALFADGEIPGFIHLSIGQEAVAAGVMSILSDVDTIASTHRGHGHGIAKGLSLNGFFAELLGKDEGLCRGRGGSMHVADVSIGMLGANGIVGAGLSLALGSALAHKTLGRPAVAVAFFGDGALAEGLIHECLNLAALWKLPLLFACENNGWSEFSPTSRQVVFQLRGLAAAYGVQYAEADGNDVEAVSAAAGAMVERLRAGDGPGVLECRTTRIRGHYEGDAQKYRSADELALTLERDPLKIVRDRLAAAGIPASVFQRMAEEAADQISSAVATARAGAPADFDAARADVYTSIAR